MRTAVAMIELIFAIVIMGIVLMSAPLLISTASKSSMVVIQQEGIAATASEVGMILTRDWDESDTNITTESPILVVQNGDGNLASTTFPDGNITGIRVGTPDSSGRKFFSSVGGTERNATLPAAFNDGDDDDIDDYNGRNITLTGTRYAGGDLADATIDMNVTVRYVSDSPSTGSYAAAADTITFDNPFNNPSANSTNIKAISINTQTGQAGLDTNISMQAFSCNIGTYRIKTRSF